MGNDSMCQEMTFYIEKSVIPRWREYQYTVENGYHSGWADRGGKASRS